MIGEALLDLADIANSVSGDFHVMHLNVRSGTFDVAHAFLKTYYEEAAADYDRWAEAALMFVDVAPNPNESASRVQWQSLKAAPMDYAGVVERTAILIEAYCGVLKTLFMSCDAEPGVANMLQTRIEYWDKERRFFNARRSI